MHNLAIALKKSGNTITGSDDEIYEPAKSRLSTYNLLPKNGWDEEHITSDLDFVILGMHAKEDNPELKKALDLKIPVLSFPEFIYEKSKDKKRIVIAGSHGKTTVTSMLMHALNKLGLDFDYAVGSTLPGFDESVKLSDAPLIIIEGDEYLSSALDRRPKFFHYKPNILLINGVAWDHINVFPTYEIYLQQFRNLIDSLSQETLLVYPESDPSVIKLVEESGFKNRIPAKQLSYEIIENKTLIDKQYLLEIFGSHNLMNLSCALEIGLSLWVSKDDFLKAMRDFKGAGKRLELIFKDEKLKVYRDFAHAPSKVEATVKAIRETFQNNKIAGLLELHTFSSLNEKFISHFSNTLKGLNSIAVYVNPQTSKSKGAGYIDESFLKHAFNEDKLVFLQETEEVKAWLEQMKNQNEVIILMSSGNLGGVELDTIFNS